MLTKRVCFVLGAGASKPYGFLSGAALMATAMEQNPPDEWWPLAKATFNADRTTHQAFIERIQETGAPSLDHFAGKVPEFKAYTKGLIAYYIGKGETRTNLIRVHPNIDWYEFFIQQLIDRANFAQVTNSRVDVVTFNFDRSFEQALLIRLAANYSKSTAQVAEALSDWIVIHVHGSLGRLPEYAKPDAGRPYEHTVDHSQFKRAVDSIKLLDEAETGSPEFQVAQELIRRADIVFFLGFGFHGVNCERVIPQTWPGSSSPPLIFGTIKGLSQGAKEKALKHFTSGPSIVTRDFNCLSLLMHYEDRFSS